MEKYLMGIDIGTSSTKGLLLTTTGKIIKQAKHSYGIKTPHAGWAEGNATDWLEAVTAVIQQLVQAINPDQLIGIGLDGLYGGSGVPVDKHNRVLGPALIWMDRRATQQVHEVYARVNPTELMQTTGNLADPYYGYLKIMWIKEHQPELYAQTARFLPPESYVIKELTGVESINYSAAGNLAGIFNINSDQWDSTLASQLGIDVAKLPTKLVEGTEVAGSILPEWAERLGVNAGTPIFNNGVDVGPATVGTGVFGPGSVTIAIGTSMNAALVTEQPLLNRNLIIWPYAYQPQKYYYNFAGANTAGAIVAWFTQEFVTEDSEQLDELSQSVPVGSNGLTVLPFFMGERSPLWDSSVRGTILGLSLKTSKLDLYNAFQEAIAFSVRQSIEQFGDQVGNSITVVGGVSNSTKMLHLIADVTGKTVKTTQSGGEADLGSAMLAGIGTRNLNPVTAQRWAQIDETVTPNETKHQLYDREYQKYRAAYQAVKPYYEKFKELD
ncbi:xylulokinase [Fructilactobacillus carniphilus]|uniref:FGGY family carbohydrate kinase n=1 Tax=Fructilactobacillus carniphilus TaxID=2940297 RepID=A0ABY5BVV3_9LACO|nr:FGGY family carbohydrate kinase [Fructilactobacillus carniphilus]USS90619.1 FGGY family carbohydrate kinase [Fructilactobacillus carniphilus]